jgi:CRISPR-associated protein Cmr6
VKLVEWITGSRSGNFEVPPSTRTLDPMPAHAGLWLDRCVLAERTDPKDHPHRQKLHEMAIRSLVGGAPARRNYEERLRLLRAEAEVADLLGVERRAFEVKTRARLLLHPATGSTVTEGGLLLHHTYGVPYLCRRRVTNLAGLPFSADKLFGNPEEGGAAPESSLVDFWDALWIPEGPASPLVEDIVNPHHPDYYTKQGERPAPSDGDAPQLTHFLTVGPGTKFLVVLEVPLSEQEATAKRLLDWIERVLREGLVEEGIGARTRSGYGVFHPVEKA